MQRNKDYYNNKDKNKEKQNNKLIERQYKQKWLKLNEQIVNMKEILFLGE